MSSVIRRTAKGGIGFILANGINKGAALLFVLVASHLLGVEIFGLLALGLSVVALLQNVALFGLPLAAQRFLSGDGEEDAPAIYGTILVLGGLVSIGVATLCFFSAGWISTRVFSEPRLEGILRVLSFSLLFGLPYILFRAVIQSQEKVRWIVTTDLVQKMGQILVAVILFLFYTSVEGFATGYVVSYFAALLLAGWHLSRLRLRPGFSKDVARFGKVLRFAVPTTFVSFSYLIAQQADKIMLGILSDSMAVGMYTVAVSVGMIISILHNSLVSVFMPIASQAYRAGDMAGLNQSYLFVSKWLGAIGGIIVLFLLGYGAWLLQLFGPGYNNAATLQVLLLISLLNFIGTWTGPTGALLLMTDRQNPEVLNTLLFVGANIALNYYLIPIYGITGAAMATLISVLVRKIIQVIEIKTWYPLKMFERVRIVQLIIVVTFYAGASIGGQVIPYLKPLMATAGMLGIVGYMFVKTLPEERAMFIRFKARFS